jgi:hypothetical protein
VENKMMTMTFGSLGSLVRVRALALSMGCSGSAQEFEDVAESPEDIIGGSNAAVGGHPWIARLWNYANGTTECAGTLIASQWLLTAAHCVDGGARPYGEVESWNLFVHLGEYHTSGVTAAEGGNLGSGDLRVGSPHPPELPFGRRQLRPRVG